MKLSLYFIVLYTFAFSCSNPKTSITEQYCYVKFDSLMRSIDSSRIETENFSEHDSIEVRDKSVKQTGVGSVFHFDPSGKLGLYAFMNNWPFSNFMILYDSNGKKQRLQNNEVVEWRYHSLKSDSILQLTVLLCAVDRNYGDLVLTAGSFCDSSIQLLNSVFTKIICFKSEIPLKNLPANSSIYLRGISGEKCSGLTSPFIDSMSIKNL